MDKIEYSVSVGDKAKILFSNKAEKSKYLANERCTLSNSFSNYWFARTSQSREQAKDILYKDMLDFAKEKGYTKGKKSNGVTLYVKRLKEV